MNNISTAEFVSSTIRSSEFVTFECENGDINIEPIYNKSYHYTNAIEIQIRKYPVLSGSTESPPPSNPEKMILST